MQIHIETGDWKTLQHPCERIRLMVFVAEQGVPKAEEIDDLFEFQRRKAVSTAGTPRNSNECGKAAS